MKKLLYFLFFMASTAYSAIQLPDYVKSLESLPADSGLRTQFRKETSIPPVVEEKNSWEKACAATKTHTPPDTTKTSPSAQSDKTFCQRLISYDASNNILYNAINF